MKVCLKWGSTRVLRSVAFCHPISRGLAFLYALHILIYGCKSRALVKTITLNYSPGHEFLLKTAIRHCFAITVAKTILSKITLITNSVDLHPLSIYFFKQKSCKNSILSYSFNFQSLSSAVKKQHKKLWNEYHVFYYIYYILGNLGNSQKKWRIWRLL